MRVDSQKLQIAMADKAYSMKGLSKKCGVSSVTISRIANGVQEARPQTIGKIARALEVPVTDIIEDAAATADDVR